MNETTERLIELTMIQQPSVIKVCNTALGKLRGFANRHARPEERKEVAEAIDQLQEIINILGGTK